MTDFSSIEEEVSSIVWCAATDAGKTDDIRHACQGRAVVECLTINGKWEPLCERHATYGPDRTRPLSTEEDDDE